MSKGYGKSTVTDYVIATLIILIGTSIVAICFYGIIYMMFDFLHFLKS